MGSYLSSQTLQEIQEETFSYPLGDSSIRVSTFCKDGELTGWIYEDAKTVYEAFQRGQRISDDGPFLGRRQNGDGAYEWLTYSQISTMADNFGSGLINECKLQSNNDTYVGIFSQNRVEWIVCDQATARFSWVLVPLYNTLGKEACKHIINEAELTVILCDTKDKVVTLLEMKDSLPSLQHIVSMELVSEDIEKQVTDLGIRIHSFEVIMASGKDTPHPLNPASPDDVCTICYTSGTTDRPKGVIITHESLLINSVTTADLMEKFDIGITKDDTFMSYLPLAHIFERMNMVVAALVGTKAGFYSGNILKFMEDVQVLQPTILPAVPRLLYKVYDNIYAAVSESYVKQYLLNWAVSSKTNSLKMGINRSDTIWDTLIFSKIRQMFGGRVRHIGIGGAPTSPQVLNFFCIALSCTIVIGYGQTELCGACNVTSPYDPSFDTVGSPMPCNMVKLVDVPELGYYQQKGFGEVCVKGRNAFTGYFKQPEKTKETIDEEGWVHTGDIGTWTTQGNLKLIDRCKQIFKLSQGEYIAPEKIENIFIRCPHVSQVFVHGESDQSFLVAIVVPDFDILKRTLSLDYDQISMEDVCKDVEIRKLVRDEMASYGKADDLKGFEIVKRVHLCPEPFTTENGLLTVTLKSKRHALKKKFQEEINDMYRE